MRLNHIALPLALVIGSLAGQAATAAVETKDSAAVAAGTYEMDQSHASVAAKVDHLGFSTTTVRFAKLAGQLSYDPARPEASTVEVTIDTASLTSDWAARDAELKSPAFFNTAKFPTAKFTASSLTKTSASTAKVSGQLTLLGVTKPVQLDIKLLGSGTGMMGDRRIGFAGQTRIKRSDFGMTTFLPAIGDEVEIVIDVEFTKK